MTQSVTATLEQRLAARSSNGNFRTLKKRHGIDFSSNDYLGFARNALPAQKNSVSGSTGSRLISGHHLPHENLEKEIAAFHGFEQALLFSTGYAANSGLLACLGDKDDLIISDELIHASLIDGIRLSYSERALFAHNDLNSLEAILAARHSEISGTIYVVIESVYSMDGDIAPLQDIINLCDRYNAALIVDEAHAIGIYGDEGRGLIAQYNLEDRVFAAIYTFGKAPGYHGAAIMGSKQLCDYCINFCRPFIYSTAPPISMVDEISLAYTRFRNADIEREKLFTVINYFRDQTKIFQLPRTQWLTSKSPIQGLMVPGNERAKALENHLNEDGFAIKAILSPTVPLKQERLRISLHSFNQPDEIDQLCAAIHHFVESETV